MLSTIYRKSHKMFLNTFNLKTGTANVLYLLSGLDALSFMELAQHDRSN